MTRKERIDRGQTGGLPVGCVLARACVAKATAYKLSAINRSFAANRCFSVLLWPLILLLLLAPLTTHASELRVFLGQYDLGAESADSHYGLEWAPATRWTGWNLAPVIGLQRTRYASHYLYTGVQRHTPLTPGGALALGVSFAAGYYNHGGNADTDLGHPLEFTSGLELRFRATDNTTLSLRGAHTSNASLDATNPGTEWIALFYGLPL